MMDIAAAPPARPDIRRDPRRRRAGRATASTLLAGLLVLAACAAPPTTPRGAGAAPSGALSLASIDYRPRGGPPPAGFVGDVPATVTTALVAALQQAGIGLDGRRCRLDGTIRDFAIEGGLWRVDIRYVLTVGGTVEFDQAIGTYHAPAAIPVGRADAEAAIAKNLAVLTADDWFRTLLRRDCPRGI